MEKESRELGDWFREIQELFGSHSLYLTIQLKYDPKEGKNHLKLISAARDKTDLYVEEPNSLTG